jgi:flagellar biosynthesis regulator FlbT
MRLRNRFPVPAIAAAALLAVMPAIARAQSPETANRLVVARQADDAEMGQPVVVVSITALDRLLKDVNYVASAAGQANAGSIFQMVATTYTNGIDRTRPIGVAMFPTEELPAAVVFVPTADVKRFLRSLEAQLGPPDELDDGTLVIAAGPVLLYIRQQGDWAYFAQSNELFDSLPADPTPWLAGMDEAYDIGVQVNVQALTKEQRESIVEQLRLGFDQAMMQQPPEQAAQIREMGAQSLDQLALVINDTAVLQFGFAIDQVAKEIRFEAMSTAVESTELAAMYAAQKSIPSKFASVIRPDVAGFFHGASSIGPQGIEQAKASLEQATGTVQNALDSVEGLSANDRVEIETFFERLIEIGVDTISEGKSDAGGMLSLADQELNLVGGFFVSDGSKVAQLAKDLAAKIEASASDKAPTFKFDAAEYKGVTMHYIEASVPASNDQARQVFGSTLRITIGTGPDAVYLAMGQNSEEMLHQLIDQAANDNGGERPLSQGQVRLLPILEFAQSINDDPTVAAMIDSLLKSNNTDTIAFVSNSIENGADFSLSIGEGILKSIGAAVSSKQGGGNGNAPQF